MKAIVDLTIIPLGIGVSLSKYVAACENILSDAGLTTQLHANGTNIEGDWDTVFAAIKQCHEVVHQMGAPRIFTTIHVGTRTDRDQSMDEKVKSVQAKLR
ncbi:MAG: MTH1187 family thiamine-binding protein [Bacteroidota bacterium]|nr:MTH1187 family thiamine-binding protein [Bacteroidota bacterium]